MGHGPSTFRKRDLATAIQAAVAAGLRIVRVEIGPTGTISLTTRPAGEKDDKADNANSSWDEVLIK